MAGNPCAHPSCGCPAPQGGDYCSAYCENVEDDTPTAEACNCGHRACEGVGRARSAVDESQISIGTAPSGRPGSSNAATGPTESHSDAATAGDPSQRDP